jgi:hypothetical protein
MIVNRGDWSKSEIQIEGKYDINLHIQRNDEQVRPEARKLLGFERT